MAIEFYGINPRTYFILIDVCVVEGCIRMRIITPFPVCNAVECNGDNLKIDCDHIAYNYLPPYCFCGDEKDGKHTCVCCKICKYIETEGVYKATLSLRQKLHIKDIFSCIERCKFCRVSVYFMYRKDDLEIGSISLIQLHALVRKEQKETESLSYIKRLFTDI
jgi:hypothetical protein